MPFRRRLMPLLGTIAALLAPVVDAQAERAFTMAQALDYPFESDVVAAEHAQYLERHRS
jgi:hypothetical protein